MEQVNVSAGISNGTHEMYSEGAWNEGIVSERGSPSPFYVVADMYVGVANNLVGVKCDNYFYLHVRIVLMQKDKLDLEWRLN